MPDTLDDRLAEHRDAITNGIEQPPLEEITQRAGVLRRRRRAARIGAVALALLVTGAVGARATLADSPTDPPIGMDNGEPAGITYRSAGLTIIGVTGTVRDIPGDVVDLEFAGPERGYLLALDCSATGTCTVHFGSTVDAGMTWRLAAAPDDAASTDRLTPPALMLHGKRVAITSNPARREAPWRYLSDDGGETWTDRLTADWAAASPVDALPPDSQVLAMPDTAGATRLYSWIPDGTPERPGLVTLTEQPPIEVRWVAPIRAGDGAWWVGGTSNGLAAVAVSRDGGRSWARTVLPEPTTTGVRVATLGSQVFLAVLGAREDGNELLALYHSRDRGATFTRATPTGQKPAGQVSSEKADSGPLTISGDLVPLLDGRLVLLDRDGRWYVSSDRGASWSQAPRLHRTSHLARTPAGYVAYRLTDRFTAFTLDGATWTKINAI